MATTSFRFKLRRGAAADWAAVNPVLMDGEPGVESDTGAFKLGDGTTAWNALDYAGKRLTEVLAAAAETAQGKVDALNTDVTARYTAADTTLAERITTVESQPALSQQTPATGTDVDTLLSRATWDVPTDTLAGTLFNLPAPTRGVLEVEANSTGTVFQTYHVPGPTRGLWYRTTTTDGSGFTGWVNLLAPIDNGGSLSGLADVDLTGVSTGQSLVYQDGVWRAATTAADLDGLTDVNTTGATAGQALVFQNGTWVPGTVATTDTGATILDELADVDTTTATPTDGQALVWNSSTGQWAPGAVSSNGLLTGRMVWRGPWGSATPYEHGDVVTTSEGIFVALTSNSSVTPEVPVDPFTDEFNQATVSPAWSINDGYTISGGRAVSPPSNTTANTRLITNLSTDGTVVFQDLVYNYNYGAPRLLFCYTDEQNHYYYTKVGTLFRRRNGSDVQIGSNGSALAFTNVTVKKTGGKFEFTHVDASTTRTMTYTDPDPLAGPGWGITHNGWSTGDTTAIGRFSYTPAPATTWGVVERKWSLRSMQDVAAAAAVEGQLLAFNGTTQKWEARTVSTAAPTVAAVVHGADAAVARPAGAVVVHWYGSVQPTNAAPRDEWIVE